MTKSVTFIGSEAPVAQQAQIPPQVITAIHKVEGLAKSVATHAERISAVENAPTPDSAVAPIADWVDDVYKDVLELRVELLSALCVMEEYTNSQEEETVREITKLHEEVLALQYRQDQWVEAILLDAQTNCNVLENFCGDFHKIEARLDALEAPKPHVCVCPKPEGKKVVPWLSYAALAVSLAAIVLHFL
jgi:hypothetical protein